MNNIVNIRSFTTARGVPTVVFIDMQKEYIATPRLIAIPNIEQALENCKKVLSHARRAGLPIVFVRWMDKYRAIFQFRNDHSRLDRRLRTATQRDDLRAQTAVLLFQRRLCPTEELGGNDLVLAGFAGEAACLSTMVDAFHRNHRIVYLKDASASHALMDIPADDVHGVVARIAALYGFVASTDTWINTETQRAAAYGE